MSKPIIKKLKLLAINVVVFAGIILVLELCVRVFMPFVQNQKIDASLFTDNRIAGSSALLPGAEGKAFGRKVSIDKYGFRSDGQPFRSGQRSWLLLGDSVTFGVGVEDEQTFGAIIDAQSENLNILNPSVPGYTCTDYRNVLQALIPSDSFNIEQVFLCYCLNDLYMRKGTDIQSGRAGFFKTTTAFLRGNSMLYNWLKALVANRPQAYYEYDAGFYELSNPSFQNALLELKYCDSLCEANGIGFTLMPMPYSYQYSKGLEEAFLPQELLTNELQNLGIEVLSGPEEAILDAFPKHPHKAYLFGDGIHFSIGGHVAVANHFMSSVSWMN